VGLGARKMTDATATVTVASTSGPVPPPTSVIVHPLVLLSATDHYMRVAKDTSKRVVGVLLGAKEMVGDRDTLRTATHEGQVATGPFLPHQANTFGREM
jgi:hypothetical protein